MDPNNVSTINCEESPVFKEELNGKDLPSSFIELCGSEDFDIQALCRICLSADAKLFSMQIPFVDGRVLADMYSSFTNLMVKPEEGLPTSVCEQCRSLVVTCYKFKTKCMKSEYTLRYLFGSLNTSERERKQESTEIRIDPELKIKHEPQYYDNEDAQDDFSDSDNETLCIVQKISKEKKTEILNMIANIDTKENLCDTKSAPKSNKKSKFKSLVCNYCSKTFFSAKTLKSHTKKTHTDAITDLPNSCPQCKDCFDTEHDLLLHVALHTKGPVWKCSDCKKEFSGRSMLRRHIQRHMEVKRYSCEVCAKPFAELYALRRHSRIHTGEQAEKRHVCSVCDKRFAECSQLAAHMSRHTGERPCVCAACGKTFPTRRLLTSHSLTHSDRKPYACQYCSKRFRHESTRNTHHRTHTGEKPYVCAACGKTFIQNSNLTLHMRTHTGEKPYKCETCGRTFSAGSSLKSHIRSHTGEKPFSCELCGKRFARVDMSGHLCKANAAAKPHTCSLCARTFTRAARLRDHMRTHTGEKPFDCDYCKHKFVSKSHLIKHLKCHNTKSPNSKLSKQDVTSKEHIASKHVVTLKNEDEDPSYKTVQETYGNVAQYDSNIEESIVKIDDDGVDVNNGLISAQEITVDTNSESEVPMAVSEELVLQEEECKPEIIVVDNTQNTFQNGTLCLTNSVNFITSDINYGNDVNLIALNEGGVSIAAGPVVENATVKLYQLDQSLLEIHSVGGQVTISKINTQYSILK